MVFKQGKFGLTLYSSIELVCIVTWNYIRTQIDIIIIILTLCDGGDGPTQRGGGCWTQRCVRAHMRGGVDTHGWVGYTGGKDTQWYGDGQTGGHGHATYISYCKYSRCFYQTTEQTTDRPSKLGL